METAAYHFHCSPELEVMLNLKAGDDAGQVEWLNINPTTEPRYGHHARANGLLLQTMMPPLHRLGTASPSLQPGTGTETSTPATASGWSRSRRR